MTRFSSTCLLNAISFVTMTRSLCSFLASFLMDIILSLSFLTLILGIGILTIFSYRGQLGKSSEESDKANDQKLPNGEEIKSKENHKDGGIQNNKENFAGCCQGANGFTCCRDGSSEESSKSEEKKLKDNVEASGKEGPLCKLSAWVGTWEQTDVLAAAALVGAVATVAVAYSYYRRSG